MNPIPGFPSYYITKKGEVYSTKRYKIPRLLKPKKSAGYLSYSLRVDGKTIDKRLHQLLVSTFVDKNYLKKKLSVNHKNGNKLDNRLCNLEIITHQQNIQHAYAIGLIKHNNPKRYIKWSRKIERKRYYKN